jgi:hypothetical protein
MRMGLALSVLCLWPQLAGAASFTSTYTAFDLKHCRQTEKPDEFIFEGAWRCKGIEGYDIFQSGADARSFAGFGTHAAGNCAYRKTFNGFNTSLSPIEWRYRDSVPIAAIERWSVAKGENDESFTWLVVNALKNGTSCQIHYVAGSYPQANAAARRAADRLAESFDCDTGTPTFDSTIGPPDIRMEPCSAFADQ